MSRAMTRKGVPEQRKLDFDAIFYLDGGVPAQDEVTSLAAIGPSASEGQRAAAFTTTHWSVVLEARGFLKKA